VLHTGTYPGQCTQICGLYHSEMLFTVRAVNPAVFTAWAHAEVATGHTLPLSGSGALNNPPPDTHVTNGSGYNTPAQAKGDQ
jgi:cytochrome c oxidase subunit 2